jgi:hypothetical protein
MSNPLLILDFLSRRAKTVCVEGGTTYKGKWYSSAHGYEIRQETRLKHHEFALSVAKLIDNGYALDLGKSPAILTSKSGVPGKNHAYTITPKGELHLVHQFDNKSPLTHNPHKPDYRRIRKMVKAPLTMSNAAAIDKWNEETNYYLPYGKDALREIS